VLGAQKVLQENLQAVRQPLRALDLIQAEHLVRGVTHLQCVSSAEAVLAGGCSHVSLHAAVSSGTQGRVLRTPVAPAEVGSDDPCFPNSTRVLFSLQGW